MSLKLYFDLLSQPSRALYILLKSLKYNFEPHKIDLAKGQHFTDEFTKINRLQKVPVIEYKGFILTESVAILRYLASENIIPESLYPKEKKLQARVDEFLEWQHIGLRLHCSMYFRIKYLDPKISGVAAHPRQIAASERRMTSALEEFDTKWLGGGRNFVAGNTVTVADLLAACEIEQPRMAGYNPMENFTNIADWMEKVRQHFEPYYTEGHVIVNNVVEKQERVEAKL